MSIIDDPMLALIARFVVDDIDHLDISDEEFLQHQLAEIKDYIGDAPPGQRQQMALQWIEEHAERYRNEWQRGALTRIVHDRRCADCPLVHDSSTSYCAIHGRWVLLLKEYMADEISSEEYIEETLDLLTRHKTSLKISEVSARIQP